MTNTVNNWKNSNLKDALSLVIDHRGLTPKKLGSNWVTEGIKTISAMNIKNGKIVNPDQIRFVNQDLYNKWMSDEIAAGDVVLTSEAPLGEAYIVKRGEKYCLSQRLFAMRPNYSELNSNYLYYYLTSDYGKKGLHDRSTGSTAKGIRQTELLKVAIPLPPLPTQEKIGVILDSIDRFIDKTDQVVERIKILKQGIIADLFEKGKKNSAWQLVKLNKITTKVTDGTHRTPKYIEDGIPFLRINDIRNHEINWSKTKYISQTEHHELIKRCKPEKGDILLSKNGTIGITKVVTWDREFSIFVSLCLIKPDFDQVLSEYLGIVLGSDYVIAQGKRRSKQGTVTNLHLEEIRDFDIPLPSKVEQKKIIAAVAAVESKLESETLQKERLIKLKNGLMQDIFSQKVEVN